MSACISAQGEFSSHALGTEGDDRFTCQACGVFDEEAALKRIAELEGTLRPPEPAPEPKTPCPEGFHWVGQSFKYCDRCGLPAWEHAGVAALPPDDDGPFGSDRWVLRPFEPGEADRVRAKWG